MRDGSSHYRSRLSGSLSIQKPKERGHIPHLVLDRRLTLCLLWRPCRRRTSNSLCPLACRQVGPYRERQHSLRKSSRCCECTVQCHSPAWADSSALSQKRVP